MHLFACEEWHVTNRWAHVRATYVNMGRVHDPLIQMES